MKEMFYKAKVFMRVELLHRIMNDTAYIQEHPKMIQRAVNSCSELGEMHWKTWWAFRTVNICHPASAFAHRKTFGALCIFQFRNSKYITKLVHVLQGTLEAGGVRSSGSYKVQFVRATFLSINHRTHGIPLCSSIYGHRLNYHCTTGSSTFMSQLDTL